jgi:cell fate regulator YaaT (PSP1 superfamily)
MVAKSQEYLVSHGKTGVLGRFLAASPELLQRGDRVVIQGDRGLTLGVVLCAATERQERLLAAAPVGRLLRLADEIDEAARQSSQQREQHLFEAARRLALVLDVPMEILDVELALDGSHLILQYLPVAGCDPTVLVDRLAAEQGVEVWLESLAAPVAEEAHDHGGCGKPDCGKSEGGCSSCGTGGCSSCGSGKVDMAAYFAHLRTKMDAERRTPLL